MYYNVLFDTETYNKHCFLTYKILNNSLKNNKKKVLNIALKCLNIFTWPHKPIRSGRPAQAAALARAGSRHTVASDASCCNFP